MFYPVIGEARSQELGTSCGSLADFLEVSFEDDDLAYDTLEVKSFTFTPVT